MDKIVNTCCIRYAPPDDILIADWNTSKWLVYSSLFFMIPSVYALALEMYMFSGLLVITSGISINHWRIATFNSTRRKADLYVAKFSFIVFFINGGMYIRYIPYLCLAYTNLALIAYAFHCSNALYAAQSPIWYKYHMLFHLCVACEQLLVIENYRIATIVSAEYTQ
jgi:hypothetical protein